MSGILERIETKLDLLIEQSSYSTTTAATPVVTTKLPELVPTSLHSLTDDEPCTVGVGLPVTTDPYAGVDKDGVVWDERIHSKAKEPISVTTGKWKRKKGITDKLYEDVTDELLEAAAAQVTPPESDNYDEEVVAETTEQVERGPFFWVDQLTGVSNTCETYAELEELLVVPTTKQLSEQEFDALQVMNVPKAPVVPKAPPAPSAPVPASPGKTAVLNLIKELTSLPFDVEANDINHLMKETTGFDTISKIPLGKFAGLETALTDWKTSLEECLDAIEQMKNIAEPNGYSDSLEEGIQSILEPYDTEFVGLVHYSNIDAVKDQLNTYLASWLEM